MLEKIRKLKDRKGFTLVELIVVLVILAILAALLVPALTGYIDKANNEKVIATTRSIIVAAQTEVSEKYGLASAGSLGAAAPITMSSTAAVTNVANADKIVPLNIAQLAEIVDGSNNLKNGITSVSITYDTEGHVTEATVIQSGRTCTYKADATNVNGELYEVSN